MEQWNNVELTNMSKKSYTLNHEYDGAQRLNKENAPPTQTASSTEPSPQCDLLQPGSDIKPKIKPEDVETLVRRLYGITISEIKELISYDDRNYFIKEDSNVKNPLIVAHCPQGYVLKVVNSLDSKKEDIVDAQNQLLLYLAKNKVQCPKPIVNACGKYYSVERFSGGGGNVVRLLEFVPGKMFHEIEVTKNLLYQSGQYLAKLNGVMKNFTHPAYESHKTIWMLQSAPQLRDFLYALKDLSRQAIIEEIIDAFELKVLSALPGLEKQIIHGDFNEQNIVVAKGPSNEYCVTGIIDFGDTSKSPVLFDIGIAMAYMMLQARDLASGGIFLSGYTMVRPISSIERDYLKYCVAARLAQSLVMGAYTHTLHPSNDYVLVTQEQGWRLIEQLWREKFDTIDELWETTGHQYLTQSHK
ncbi:hydroxylysine kinase [Scaptodrosophila lebanonensis]|uniref:Hydroxylysine kinase n=1 Tax=Drosophila lebanonensis TaxID=7225 RepID=A0A6J2UAU6_DROLE|nr:hydroxylysine kinase [Scaptodrosophila lebanonensis]